MKTSQITVENFPLVNSDFDICDVARVSMAKTANLYTKIQNVRLLNYLVRDKKKPHWSPFGHARICLKVEDSVEKMFELFPELLLKGNLAGFSWEGDSTEFYINGSLWAWYENWALLHPVVREAVSFHGKRKYPETWNLLFNEEKECQWGSYIRVIQNGGTDRTNYRSFRVTCPIFIARQLVKHQVHMCWNEESRRYIDESPVFFDPVRFRTRPEGSIKQGSGGYLNEEDNANAMSILGMSNSEAHMAYKYLLSIDVAPEEARMVLPLNTQVQWIWTASVEAWKRVLKLRDDPHAQTQAQDFAKKLRARLEEIQYET